MAQFDVYENINEKTKEQIPFLLDIQNDILNPKYIINETVVVLSTAELASIPLEYLGEKVFSLEEKREEIISAVDFLVTGF